MSTTPSERTLHSSDALGFTSGTYIQEIGYDDDVDFDLRDAIAAVTGEEMADDDVDDVFDAVVMWWRSDDPDLADAIVDAQSTLKEGGIVWLLTPKAGRPGHIETADISQAAPTAGMHVTRTVSAAPDWAGFRLVGKKNYS
ncbi:DUF3052 domain-containing protein [Brevibacterium samyangense]|uniref:DUF3052 domain-containing protein n=1 Tax=Brevibacterium samyangense TaxID=366888 RepID=UPI0031DC210C